mmetsp:Transcript_44834/g.87898  ORF Transcript_44834/g.87898 Transcript_44834/m.87898 type:complete len:254 (-) Transcript_44834:1034-1795(-)
MCNCLEESTWCLRWLIWSCTALSESTKLRNFSVSCALCLRRTFMILTTSDWLLDCCWPFRLSATNFSMRGDISPVKPAIMANVGSSAASLSLMNRITVFSNSGNSWMIINSSVLVSFLTLQIVKARTDALRVALEYRAEVPRKEPCCSTSHTFDLPLPSSIRISTSPWYRKNKLSLAVPCLIRYSPGIRISVCSASMTFMTKCLLACSNIGIWLIGNRRMESSLASFMRRPVVRSGSRWRVNSRVAVSSHRVS